MTMGSFESRWYSHRKDLRNGTHKCRGLKRAVAKYGIDAFTFEILQAFDSSNTLEGEVLQAEQDWWDNLASEGVRLYNGRPTGTGSVVHTEESRTALRATIEAKLREKHHIDGELLRDARGRALVTKECPRCNVGFIGSPRRKYCSMVCGAKNNANNNRTKAIDKEQLRKLYLEDDLSIAELCDALALKKSSVYGLLMKYSIPTKRSPGLNRR